VTPLVDDLSRMSSFLGIVASSYSRSDSYVKDLAVYLGNAPDHADWFSASTGLTNVSSQLKGMFALHLGKIIVKVTRRLKRSVADSQMALRTRNVFTKMFISKQAKESMAQENARLLLQAQHDLNSLAGQFEAGREGSIRQLEWYEQEQVREQQRSLASQKQQPHPTQPQQPQSSPVPPSYSVSHTQQYSHQSYAMQQTTQQPGMVYVMTEEVRENDRNDCVIA
jgi:hypothetical protein